MGWLAEISADVREAVATWHIRGVRAMMRYTNPRLLYFTSYLYKLISVQPHATLVPPLLSPFLDHLHLLL